MLDLESCEQWVSVDVDLLRHFELAGADGVYHSATSEIVQATRLKVHSAEGSVPVRARYAWVGFLDIAVNLFRRSGLPASPFEIRVLHQSSGR